jgi:biotin carboxyl carrier protein
MTRRRPARRSTAASTPGSAPASVPPDDAPAPPAPTEATPPIDPRAVRVAVVATSRADDDPTLAVSPAPLPVLRPVERLAGTAILGGIPSPTPSDTSGDGRRPGSSATHPAAGAPVPGAGRMETDPTDLLIVDGEPVSIGLRSLDAEHAVLVEASGEGSARSRVVLGREHRRERDGAVTREVVIDGWRIEVEFESERRASLRERARRASDVSGRTGPVEVRAIIPGRIVALSVGAGEAVNAGQQLLVLEAMKMQNELRAPREGTIERIPIAVGQNVEVGDLLMVIT